jgi:hypothetical protein
MLSSAAINKLSVLSSSRNESIFGELEMLKRTQVSILATLAALVAVPAMAADGDAQGAAKAGAQTQIGVDANTQLSGPGLKLNQGLKLNEKSDAAAGKIADKAEDKADDKANQGKKKGKDAAKSTKSKSEQAKAHAGDAKNAGQDKADSAKEPGNNNQGVDESAKQPGNNRQGVGVGVGAEGSARAE